MREVRAEDFIKIVGLSSERFKDRTLRRSSARHRRRLTTRWLRYHQAIELGLCSLEQPPEFIYLEVAFLDIAGAVVPGADELVVRRIRLVKRRLQPRSLADQRSQTVLYRSTLILICGLE